MNAQRFVVVSAAVILMASLAGGCASYDYLQRTDRISYRAGNAVNANLERETIVPWSWSMFDTSGLGANGSVIKPAATATPGTTPPAAPSTSPPPPASPL